MNTQYMHTLDGRPAYFNGEQIVFWSLRGPAVQLEPHRGAIRKQQRATKRFRESNEFGFAESRYGYIRVRVWEKHSTQP